MANWFMASFQSLALRNITADWGRAAKDWKEAMNQFAILYAERFETAHV